MSVNKVGCVELEFGFGISCLGSEGWSAEECVKHVGMYKAH